MALSIEVKYLTWEDIYSKWYKRQFIKMVFIMCLYLKKKKLLEGHTLK